MRNSRDGTVNAEGERMLRIVEERGWYILNGRTEGDECGEFMYVTGRRKSVIDYVVANSMAKQKIRRFKVEEKIESDHLPLEMELEGIRDEGAEEELHEEKVSPIGCGGGKQI